MGFGYPRKDQVPHGHNFTAFLNDSFVFIATFVSQNILRCVICRLEGAVQPAGMRGEARDTKLVTRLF